MPSHDVHRRCGSIIGLPDNVVSFVDMLIDVECPHDVGLEPLTAEIRVHNVAAAKVVIKTRGEALALCLLKHNATSQEHLFATALHLILDCIDRRIKAHGLYLADNKDQLIEACKDDVINRILGIEKPRGATMRLPESLRRSPNLLEELLKEASEKGFSMLLPEWSPEYITHCHELFGLSSRECEEYMDRIPWILAGVVELLSEAAQSKLKECIDLIVAENAGKSIRYVMPATISSLFSEIRYRLNASGMFYVNNVQLPLVLTVNRAFGEIRRGIPVRFQSAGGLIIIDAPI